MKISNIPEKAINIKRYHALNHTSLLPFHRGTWRQGWDAAIRFVKRAENAAAICEHCGKFIQTLDECYTDVNGCYFCEKCYEKLISKHNN